MYNIRRMVVKCLGLAGVLVLIALVVGPISVSSDAANLLVGGDCLSCKTIANNCTQGSSSCSGVINVCSWVTDGNPSLDCAPTGLNCTGDPGATCLSGSHCE
jgi:hypothetical protein